MHSSPLVAKRPIEHPEQWIEFSRNVHSDPGLHGFATQPCGGDETMYTELSAKVVSQIPQLLPLSITGTWSATIAAPFTVANSALRSVALNVDSCTSSFV